MLEAGREAKYPQDRPEIGLGVYASICRLADRFAPSALQPAARPPDFGTGCAPRLTWLWDSPHHAGYFALRIRLHSPRALPACRCPRAVSKMLNSFWGLHCAEGTHTMDSLHRCKPGQKLLHPIKATPKYMGWLFSLGRLCAKCYADVKLERSRLSD